MNNLGRFFNLNLITIKGAIKRVCAGNLTFIENEKRSDTESLEFKETLSIVFICSCFSSENDINKMCQAILKESPEVGWFSVVVSTYAHESDKLLWSFKNKRNSRVFSIKFIKWDRIVYELKEAPQLIYFCESLEKSLIFEYPGAESIASGEKNESLFDALSTYFEK